MWKDHEQFISSHNLYDEIFYHIYGFQPTNVEHAGQYVANYDINSVSEQKKETIFIELAKLNTEFYGEH